MYQTKKYKKTRLNTLYLEFSRNEITFACSTLICINPTLPDNNVCASTFLLHRCITNLLKKIHHFILFALAKIQTHNPHNSSNTSNHINHHGFLVNSHAQQDYNVPTQPMYSIETTKSFLNVTSPYKQTSHSSTHTSSS